MATQVSTSERAQQVARPLKVLVPLIKEDLRLGDEAAKTAGMAYFIAAGEKLIEAKDQMSHGEFGGWIKRNFDISRVTSSKYMEAAAQKLRASDFSSMNAFHKATGNKSYMPNKPRPQPWHEPVKEGIEQARRDAERIRDEALTRQQERDAERKLAIQLIDIGFKALASKLHPDKGGSRDAMSRLNRVRDRLKQHA